MKRFAHCSILMSLTCISLAYAQTDAKKETQAEEVVPAVVYEKAATWGDTVALNRSALHRYKASILFSSDADMPTGEPIAIDVDIRGKHHLWLASSHRGRTAWGSPELVRADGTSVSLTTLEPLSTDLGKGKLRVDDHTLAGQAYPKSLHVPASSKVGYELGGDFQRLKAVISLNEVPQGARFGYHVCTAPVCEMPDDIADTLFEQIDGDFPDQARVLLVNGIEDERRELLNAADPMPLIGKAIGAALDRLQAHGEAHRVNLQRLDSQASVEQRLALLDRVLRSEIDLFEARDQIKQAVPVLSRFTHDFSLELKLLSERAAALQHGILAPSLAAFRPGQDIAAIEEDLRRIESNRLKGDHLPLSELQVIGDRAQTLAQRLDHHLGWPAVRRDNRRSGVSYEELKMPLRAQWTHTPTWAPKPAWPAPARVNRAVQSDPLDPTLTYDRAFHTVVHEGRVYYGSSADDSVHCLDLQTGKTLWTFTTNGPVRLAPTLYAGKCYVGSDDGHLYCIDARSGALLWKFRAGPATPWVPGNGRIISSFPVRCGICVSDNIVYFGAGLFPRQGTFLCAVNAETGEKIFVEPQTFSPQGFMLLTPTRIMVSTGRTPFVMCDRQTGKQLEQLGVSKSWGQDLKGGSFAVVIEDRVATGPSEDGHIHLFNSERIKSVFRSAGQQVLVSGPTAYILRKDGLFAIDRRQYLLEKKESLKWRVRMRDAQCMIMAGDVVFCGTEGGVAAIHADSGAQLWTSAIEGRVEGLVVSQGNLLVNTASGKTYCFTEMSRAYAEVGEPETRSEIAADAATAQLAADLLSLAKVKKGYVLLQNCGDVALAAQLAQHGELRIVCAESDETKVDQMRSRLRAAGLYGGRVVCHHWPGGQTPYQRYVFNVIVTRAQEGDTLPASEYASLHRQLRPHGGLLAVIGAKHTPHDPLLGQADWTLSEDPGLRFAYHYRGALEGEGQWTHPYADAGNSACSNDVFTFTDTTIQWFGGPGPRNIVDRHLKSPPPVYTKGRVFVTGADYIVAVDAYNGNVLWDTTLAESGRVRIPGNCGNLVAMDERLYVAHGAFCTAFDAQTGRQVFQASTEQPNSEWGYLAYVNGALLGSSGHSGSINRPLLRWPELKQPEGDFSCSYELFACDPQTGKRMWAYQPECGAIINPAIACTGDRVILLESLNPDTLKAEKSRTDLKSLLANGIRMVALDVTTGEQAWEATPEVQNIQHIVYLSATQDTVVITGSCHVEVGKTLKNRYSMIAYDTATGKQRWASLDVPGYEDATDGNHGALNQHPVIVGDIVYGNGYARYLKTGEDYPGWKWSKSHKCTTLSASGRCAFSRYEKTKLPFMFDLETGTRTPLTTVSRPGCWINMLPVGGLIVIPEGSAGCTCGYSIQTSLALSPEMAESGPGSAL